MIDMESLHKYYDALMTGDPDRQVRDGDDVLIVEFAIKNIADLKQELELMKAIRPSQQEIDNMEAAGKFSHDNNVILNKNLDIKFKEVDSLRAEIETLEAHAAMTVSHLSRKIIECAELKQTIRLMESE